MNGFSIDRLGNLCVKIGSGATPLGGKESYLQSGDIALIRSQNVLDFSFSVEGLAFITDKQAAALKNVAIQRNDVLINITGDSVARVCSVPDSIKEARVNQHVAILRTNPNRLSSSFLKYYLLQPIVKERLLTLSSSGATRKALTKEMLEELELGIPPLLLQHRIAEILSALDDKIELNRQMNHTLEQMAQVLYKHYFLDGIDPENLPEGWNKALLKDMYQTTSGGTPSRVVPEYYGGNIPWVKSKELNGSFIIGTEEKISEKGLIKSSAKILPRNTVLLAMYGATVGEIGISSMETTCNQAICAILPNDDYPFSFIFYFLKLNKESIINMAVGSAQQNLSQEVISNIDIVLPPKQVMQAYHEKVEPKLQIIENNIRENHTLAMTRDYLLPKLISGEIIPSDLKQIEKAI